MPLAYDMVEEDDGIALNELGTADPTTLSTSSLSLNNFDNNFDMKVHPGRSRCSMK